MEFVIVGKLYLLVFLVYAIVVEFMNKFFLCLFMLVSL